MMLNTLLAAMKLRAALVTAPMAEMTRRFALPNLRAAATSRADDEPVKKPSAAQAHQRMRVMKIGTFASEKKRFWDMTEGHGRQAPASNAADETPAVPMSHRSVTKRS